MRGLRPRNRRIDFFLVSALAIAITASLSMGQTQSAPGTSTAPGTQVSPDLSTPQKAAAAYYRALMEQDGPLLLACVDLKDENVKFIITGMANSGVMELQAALFD